MLRGGDAASQRVSKSAGQRLCCHVLESKSIQGWVVRPIPPPMMPALPMTVIRRVAAVASNAPFGHALPTTESRFFADVRAARRAPARNNSVWFGVRLCQWPARVSYREQSGLFPYVGLAPQYAPSRWQRVSRSAVCAAMPLNQNRFKDGAPGYALKGNGAVSQSAAIRPERRLGSKPGSPAWTAIS